MLSAIDPTRVSNILWTVLSSVVVLLAGALTNWGIKLIKSKMETERHRRQVIDELAKMMPQLLRIVTAFEQTAADAKSAKELSQQQVEQGKAQQKQIDSIKSDLGQIRDEMLDVDKRMARFIVHEARNDLSASRLAKEAEDLLADDNAAKRFGHGDTE